MKHNFEYTKLGNLSSSLLSTLKEYAPMQDYSTKYNWPISDCNKLTASEPVIAATILELESLIKPRGFYSAVINKLPGLSYVPEHTDQCISKIVDQYVKLHIPIITSSKVGFMWPGYDQKKAAKVTLMSEGEIYLFNNIAKHAVVNLSTTDRYHLVLEFREIQCAEL